MNEEEQKYFNDFKKSEITETDMKKAVTKSNKLGNNKNNFIILIKMLKDSINGKYNLPTWAIATITGAIIYVISPIDAVPDILPIVGWTDDSAVVATVVATLGKLISDYKNKRLK